MKINKITKKIDIVLAVASLVLFCLGILNIISVLLAGGSVVDYWAAVWKETTDVRILTEQAYLFFVGSFVLLVVREIIDKDAE